MSLKLKAALHTVLLCAAGILVANALTYIADNVDTETIKTFVSVVCISFLVYIVYSLLLARLVYRETVDKVNSGLSKLSKGVNNGA